VAKPESERIECDPDDQMVRSIVGAWTLEKHRLLCRYVDITKATRRKWVNRSPAFIDLYCGPGRSRIDQTHEIMDGGVLAAAKEAGRHTPFSQIVIADMDQAMLAACQARLESAGYDRIRAFLGPAAETARRAVDACDPEGLHLAYLDPFSIHALPFEVIKRVGEGLKRADLFIHFSVMDFKRNLVQMQGDGRLETFAPRWQSAIKGHVGVEELRRVVFEHWLGLIRGLGYHVSEKKVSVSGAGTADFYWLILASRHPIADKFWNVAADIDPQRSLL